MTGPADHPGGPLVVAVAQPLTVAHDVAGNAERHAAAVRVAGARLVVFPEMSLTGYEFDAEPVDQSDPRLAPLVAACGRAGSIALAGAPVAAPGGGTSIGTLLVDGDRARVVYRKMWLGAAEAAHFVPGGDPAVVEVDRWRIGVAVCKDTGVPRHAAETVALGAEVYAAGVLEHDVARAVPGERARRIAADHGVWVAVASFAGATGEGFGHAAGRSGIWRPDGTVAAEAGPDPGGVVTVRIGSPV